MINQPQPTPASRAPRMLAFVNGQPVMGLLDFDVDNNSHYMADTFTARVSLSKQPAAMNWAWWVAQAGLTLELYAGFPADPARYTKADLKRYMYGQVDKISDDPANGVMLLSGRDLTANFIDAKTTEKFQNLTASQIIQKLAARHNMQADVTATTTKAGTYYQLDHARMNATRTEWDLMTFLAREENMSLWVDGQTVYFHPLPSATDNPYVLKWQPETATDLRQANAMRICFERNLTLANDVIVHIRSWHGKAKKAYTKTAKAQHTKGPQSTGGKAQEYWFNFPGLTPEQCQQKANSLLKEISRHEKRLTATLAGDDLLTPRTVLQVIGTGTGYDQIYYPSSIKREFSWDAGYRMTVDAKNHSTETETQV